MGGQVRVKGTGWGGTLRTSCSVFQGLLLIPAPLCNKKLHHPSMVCSSSFPSNFGPKIRHKCLDLKILPRSRATSGGAAGAVTARGAPRGAPGQGSPLCPRVVGAAVGWGQGFGVERGVWGCALSSGHGSGMGLAVQVDLGLTWDGMGMEMGIGRDQDSVR